MESIERINVHLRIKDTNSFGERATRWQELEQITGGDSIFELYPDFKSYSRLDSEVLDAMEEYAQEWWRQGLLCFIDKLHLPCITCMAFSLEASLKYALILKNPGIRARYDLKKCIGTCQTNRFQILPSDNDNSISVAANRVLQSRDDVVHANIPLERPGTVIYGEGPEHEITGDRSDIQFVEEFKNLAKQTILDAKTVIDYLVSNNSPPGDRPVDV